MTVIVDVFNDIVCEVQKNLLGCLTQRDKAIEGIHYQHGHPLEIIQTLSELDKSRTFKFKKYPLIALFQDFPEYHNTPENGLFEVTLHLIIAMNTNSNYKASDRYEKNFHPFLYPIYNELMKQIHYSKHFMTLSKDAIQHTKIDRLFWGREGLYGNEGNIFNDHLDVIEIKDLKLKTYTKIC